MPARLATTTVRNELACDIALPEAFTVPRPIVVRVALPQRWLGPGVAVTRAGGTAKGLRVTRSQLALRAPWGLEGGGGELARQRKNCETSEPARRPPGSAQFPVGPGSSHLRRSRLGHGDMAEPTAPKASPHARRPAPPAGSAADADEVDPYDLMLERSGCAKQHYALQVRGTASRGRRAFWPRVQHRALHPPAMAAGERAPRADTPAAMVTPPAAGLLPRQWTRLASLPGGHEGVSALHGRGQGCWAKVSPSRAQGAPPT